MANTITTVGWFGFLVGIAYFFLFHRPDAAQSDYVTATRNIFLTSGGLVIAGYALKYLGTLAGVDSGRCQKCGKRIEKQGMFCFDHRIEKIHQAQDRVRKAETGKFKKPQLRP